MWLGPLLILTLLNLKTTSNNVKHAQRHIQNVDTIQVWCHECARSTCFVQSNSQELKILKKLNSLCICINLLQTFTLMFYIWFYFRLFLVLTTFSCVTWKCMRKVASLKLACRDREARKTIFHQKDLCSPKLTLDYTDCNSSMDALHLSRQLMACCQIPKVAFIVWHITFLDRQRLEKKLGFNNISGDNAERTVSGYRYGLGLRLANFVPRDVIIYLLLSRSLWHFWSLKISFWLKTCKSLKLLVF